MEISTDLSVDLVTCGQGSTFEDGWVHVKTIPETILAQVISGRYEIASPTGHAFIERGELFLIGGNLPMTITHHYAEDDHMASRWMHCRFLLFGQVDLSSMLEMPLRVSGKPAAELGDIIGRFVREKEETGKDHPERWHVRAARRQEDLFKLMRTVCEISDLKDSGVDFMQGLRRLVPLFEFLEENLARSFGVEEMARSVHMSPSRFHAFFRERMGRSPMTYVRSLRIRRAARLLTSTDMSVARVAEAVGFRSQFHFSRVFKKHRGVPPLTFRREGKISFL
jgi:AraC-like DNA-binding protein